MLTVLSKVPLFSGLTDVELEAIHKNAVTRSFPRNTIVIHEGDASDSLYVIISGEVKVYLSDEQGKEIIINTQGPEEYFGEMALIDDNVRSASVMTTKKSSLYIISKRDFKVVLADHPDIAISLIKEMARRVRILTDNVKSLALLDVYGRVAKTLLGLAHDQDGKLIIEDKLTQQDIANRVGASREMVARILKDLTTGGYISVEQKKIVIHERLPSGY